MATYVKYEPFIQGLCDKLFDLFGTTDTLKVVIHSDAPVVATDDELADLTQITGTGYTAGGEDTQNDSTRSGGTVTMTGVDVVWTASAADWAAGRYVSMHDDTSTTDRLIASWDYGANFTLGNGETFTVDFGASILTMT
ncbi:hypothetical protein ACHMW7_16145 [Aminobacter sp. UC22_36]|uniref:hypothetical protein n=1 Tax=Aminobacter sp. UC22_36 TaxID=3374549 RepID=UPI0037581CD6